MRCVVASPFRDAQCGNQPGRTDHDARPFLHTQVKSKADIEQAVYARDAFAKGAYDRAFTWLVQRINKNIVYTVGAFPRASPTPLRPHLQALTARLCWCGVC